LAPVPRTGFDMLQALAHVGDQPLEHIGGAVQRREAQRGLVGVPGRVAVVAIARVPAHQRRSVLTEFVQQSPQRRLCVSGGVLLARVLAPTLD